MLCILFKSIIWYTLTRLTRCMCTLSSLPHCVPIQVRILYTLTRFTTYVSLSLSCCVSYSRPHMVYPNQAHQVHVYPAMLFTLIKSTCCIYPNQIHQVCIFSRLLCTLECIQLHSLPLSVPTSSYLLDRDSYRFR